MEEKYTARNDLSESPILKERLNVLDKTRLACAEFVEHISHTAAPFQYEICNHAPFVKLPETALKATFLFCRGQYLLEEIPDDITSSSLQLGGCSSLRKLPKNKVFDYLLLEKCTALKEIPEGLRAMTFLNLSGCRSLQSIAASATDTGGAISIADCVSLREIPRLNCNGLEMAGCINLGGIPDDSVINMIHGINSCQSLQFIGNNVKIGGSCDLSGLQELERIGTGCVFSGDLRLENCKNINTIPNDLVVHGDLHLTRSGIKEIPETLQVSGRIFL